MRTVVDILGSAACERSSGRVDYHKVGGWERKEESRDSMTKHMGY